MSFRTMSNASRTWQIPRYLGQHIAAVRGVAAQANAHEHVATRAWFRRATPPSAAVWKTLAGLSILGAAQYSLGEGTDIFEHKFTTTKSPDDLCDFYGTEDFMEIFCVFPFMINFMMRRAEFDEEGTIHAQGLLGSGELEVSIEFEEEEIDVDGDGTPDTVAWFNKREHFEDTSKLLGGLKLWEMTQNFGYHRKDDGTCEIYHHGEYFKGIFPVRLILQLHAKYVIWATERFINSDAFGTEDGEVEAEVIRQNIPAYAFNEFLAGLTHGVQKVKESTGESDIEKRNKLDVTLRRLETLRSKSDTENAPLHRLRTVRRSSGLNARATRVGIEVDDKETRDTLRMALEQIGRDDGTSHRPVQSIRRLTRRVTAIEHENDSVN